MNHDFVNLFPIGIAFLVLLAIAELLKIRFSISAEFTRKLIHLIGGIVSSFFIFLIEEMISAIIMALMFFFLVLASKRTGFLKSVHAVHRKSIGGYIFPLSICLIFLLTRIMKLPDYAYFSSIMVLSLSDPMASLGGYINKKINNNNWGVLIKYHSGLKTLLGSLLFLNTSVIILILIFFNMTGFPLYDRLIFSILISVIATVTELFSFRGWDNLTCPLVVWASILMIEWGIV